MDKNLQLNLEKNCQLKDCEVYKEKFTNWKLSNLADKIKSENIIKKYKYSHL